jgi:hypothetical protein
MKEDYRFNKRLRVRVSLIDKGQHFLIRTQVKGMLFWNTVSAFLVQLTEAWPPLEVRGNIIPHPVPRILSNGESILEVWPVDRFDLYKRVEQAAKEELGRQYSRKIIKQQAVKQMSHGEPATENIKD